MRGLIYDLITGMAIIASLFIITDVMKANQKFIATSAIADTKVEQLYMESDSNLVANSGNAYTILDVYGTFRNFITTEDRVMEGIEIIINFKGAGDGIWNLQSISLDDTSSQEHVINQEVAILRRVNYANSNATYAKYRYTVDKSYDSTHKKMKYTITQK